METSEQDVSTFRLILVSMRVLFCLVFEIVDTFDGQGHCEDFWRRVKKKRKGGVSVSCVWKISGLTIRKMLHVHLLIVFVYAMMFLETSRRFLFTDHSFFHLTFSLVLTNRKKSCSKSGRWCDLTVITESRLLNILYPSS
jgi:hypothetical protein